MALLGAFVMAAATVAAQSQNPPPRPFPGANTQPKTAQPAAQTPAQGNAAHGVPLYPGADFLGKYEPGPNQEMYLYGTSGAFATVVEYYKAALKDGGRKLFGGPMHQFDLGRYRRETMTLQPAVTVKDFTWNGREGYVHVSGRQIVKYPTVIQVVPAGPER